MSEEPGVTEVTCPIAAIQEGLSLQRRALSLMQVALRGHLLHGRGRLAGASERETRRARVALRSSLSLSHLFLSQELLPTRSPGGPGSGGPGPPPAEFSALRLCVSASRRLCVSLSSALQQRLQSPRPTAFATMLSYMSPSDLLQS